MPPNCARKQWKKLAVVGLANKANTRADVLSGGQQQRVAIAGTLIQNPVALFADGPVASLDPAASHSVMQYLERMNKEFGVTVVCNLRFLGLVRQYASRVFRLESQREMMFQSSPLEIDREWFSRIYGEEAVEVDIR